MGETLRIFAIVAAAMLLRWCVGYHPYSGEGKPPMYGDYEAQRHWQEITKNLPPESWYTNSSDNDMQYWGLDYPPLTAYHSLALGEVASRLNPKFVELRSSRGFESPEHKLFMRFSVFVADLAIYVPALIFFVRHALVRVVSGTEKSNFFGMKRLDMILATALIYPGLIIIDHGHFQYNCVSLGLFVGAVALILCNRSVIASFLFVLALNYKQMELYHSMPFFLFILGNNTPGRRKTLLSCVRALICVSLTVIITFFAVWAPFAQKWEVFRDAILRLFPLDRGLFEDKVSNVWCVVNVFYKFREHFDNSQLARISLVATLTAIAPSSINLYLKPHKEKFIVSLINCSLGFYLFSFQVHEKSILLVALPILMYLHRDPLVCFWFLTLSTFSMLPLIINDRLVLPYFALNIFYTVAVYLMWPRELSSLPVKETAAKSRTRNRETSIGQRKFRGKQNARSRFADSRTWANRINEKILNLLRGHDFLTCRITSALTTVKIILFRVSLVGALILSITSVSVEPPEKYPDLHALLVSAYCCLHFVGFFLYFNYKQIYGLQKNPGKTKLH